MKRVALAIALITAFLSSSAGALANSPAAQVVITVADNRISASSADGSTQLSSTQPLGTDVVLATSLQSTISGEVLPAESLRVLITLNEPSAAHQYSFEIPGACHLQELTFNQNSIFRVSDCEGGTLVWLGAPWARDSADRDVPTSYALKGGVLTQNIDSGDGNFEYPITADPYLGLNLVSKVVYTYPGDHPEPNLSIAVTPWLGTVYGVGTVSAWTSGLGYQVATNHAWPEVQSKLSATYGSYPRAYVDAHATYFDQFRCHALGAPLIFAATVSGIDTRPTWDFEGYRSPSSDIAIWIKKKCNW